MSKNSHTKSGAWLPYKLLGSFFGWIGCFPSRTSLGQGCPPWSCPGFTSLCPCCGAGFGFACKIHFGSELFISKVEIPKTTLLGCKSNLWATERKFPFGFHFVLASALSNDMLTDYFSDLVQGIFWQAWTFFIKVRFSNLSFVHLSLFRGTMVWLNSRKRSWTKDDPVATLRWCWSNWNLISRGKIAIKKNHTCYLSQISPIGLVVKKWPNIRYD